MSLTKAVLTVSNVGSAPLLALKNLPSLLDVPCSNFASVTASSAIFNVVTLPFNIAAVTTALSAILGSVIASFKILSDVTEPFCNIAVVTVLLLGVPIPTDAPIVMMKKSAPLAGAAENIISAPEIVKPSLGWLDPLLGF